MYNEGMKHTQRLELSSIKSDTRNVKMQNIQKGGKRKITTFYSEKKLHFSRKAIAFLQEKAHCILKVS